MKKILLNVFILIFILLILCGLVINFFRNNRGIVEFNDLYFVVSDEDNLLCNINKGDFIILDKYELVNLSENINISYFDRSNIRFGQVKEVGRFSSNQVSVNILNNKGVNYEVHEGYYIGIFKEAKIPFIGYLFKICSNIIVIFINIVIISILIFRKFSSNKKLVGVVASSSVEDELEVI